MPLCLRCGCPKNEHALLTNPAQGLGFLPVSSSSSSSSSTSVCPSRSNPGIVRASGRSCAQPSPVSLCFLCSGHASISHVKFEDEIASVPAVAAALVGVVAEPRSGVLVQEPVGQDEEEHAAQRPGQRRPGEHGAAAQPSHAESRRRQDGNKEVSTRMGFGR